MKKTFRTKLAAAGIGEVGLIEIPFDVKAAFGAARPKVRATVKSVTWRTPLPVYGGKTSLGLRKEVVPRSRARTGEVVGVLLEADPAPRGVPPPAALAAALKRSRAARAG